MKRVKANKIYLNSHYCVPKNYNLKLPTVIFIHGIMSNLGSWFLYRKSLETRGYKTLTYDLRCHGRSDKVIEECTLLYHAKDLMELIEHYRIETNNATPILIGYSYGCLIITKLLELGVIRARSVIFIEPPHTSMLKESFGITIDTDKAEEISKTLATQIKSTLTNFTEKNSGTRRHKQKDFLEKVTIASIESMVVEVIALTHSFYLENLNHTKVLCIFGSLSGSYEAHKCWIEKLKNSDCKVIKGYGHAVNIQQFKLVYKEIEDYLDALS